MKRVNDVYTLESDTGERTQRHASHLLVMNAIQTAIYLVCAISLCATIITTETLFYRVKTVIWLKTESKVALGTVEYDVNFAYVNPCSLFRRNVKAGLAPDEKLSSNDETELEAFEKNCRGHYAAEWLREIDQLL